jgi:hypothetical protein
MVGTQKYPERELKPRTRFSVDYAEVIANLHNLQFAKICVLSATEKSVA